VAIHNIPEGIAVSVPILYATGSRRRAFLYSFFSGLAEPVGAILGFALLRPFLTPDILSITLAVVAGIMIYISLDEILPMAHRYGRSHLVIMGLVAGMAIMALSLGLLN
jgi:ZIP family zinc transporter